MKEATGEVSMTVVTLVAIGVIGAILAGFWPQIKTSISGLFGGESAAEACKQQGLTWDSKSGTCK